MSSLIVIRIIPQQAVDPATFTGYLNPAGLGPLQITAFDLSFGNPSEGQNVGTVSFIAPTTSPSPISPVVGSPTLISPQYSGNPASSIVQQYDLSPSVAPESAFFQLESVATAVIEVATGTKIENLRIEAQWGSGASATPLPVTTNFYDVQVSAGPAPDLNAWAPSSISLSLQPDPWAALPPSLYLQIAAPSTTANPFSFQLPTDGTPPPFDALLQAVRQTLTSDPGGAVTATTAAAVLAGSRTLQFPALIAGVTPGMSATAGTAIPSGAVVAVTDSTGLVTLSEELAADVPAGTSVTFAPNLAGLSVEQCRNIAYEIVWAQQPPPPSPPDPVEELYSNPPNTGKMLSGTTPNQFEGERQEFEAELKTYYTLADTAADRLMNFVFALSAAVACEQQSLAATEALLEFPPNPAGPGVGSLGGQKIVLTAIEAIAPPTNFGVPAAYFYGLGAQLPLQIGALQRFKLATGDLLDHLLADLTAAINAGTVSDGEQFVGPAPSSINAAQAARRIAALGISAESSLPQAPLHSFAIPIVADTASGKTLTFTSTATVKNTMLVSGPNIPMDAKIGSLTDTTVTLTVPLLGDVPLGSSIVFTPPYTVDLTALIQSWLNFPPVVAGVPSSQSYQAEDDVTQFWPAAANAHPAAFLNLVLCALTEGFMLSAPFNVALGDMITTTLLPSATVGALASVTGPQWTKFFQDNPTWLPPGTGSTAARIAAFLRRVQTFFVLAGGGPTAPFVLVTTAAAAVGATVLEFAPTPAVLPGMALSGNPNLPPGTAVAAGGVTTTATATSVTLTKAITAAIPVNTNITFSVVASAGAGTAISTLPLPSQDWLTACLTAYGAFTLGGGFDLSKLDAAASTVFPGDDAAQSWIVGALVTLDALYQVLKSVPLPPPGTAALEFSILEALYARGFTSAAKITEITGGQFQEALIGTVAYDLAGAIYTSAEAIAPPAPSNPPGAIFVPVNPDGSLTNCVAPPCASALGPIAYLSELLKLSELSTCEKPIMASVSLPTSTDTTAGLSLPFISTRGLIRGMSAEGTNVPGKTTVTDVSPTSVTLSQAVTGKVPGGTLITFTPVVLGAVLSGRRGPIGNLAASCANAETPLPVIDIVNECLEYLGAQASPLGGTVYDTSAEALATHVLCQEEPCPETKCKPFCHDPARIFAALPEYSTPATPVAANSAVEPAVYDKLKIDFSSCDLPYSQALDISRTYLGHFGSCRFEEMRTFRRCITEFVLDPRNEPPGFEDHLWRYPVRIDTAIEYLGISPQEYTLLFLGDAPASCGVPQDQRPRRDPAEGRQEGGPAVWQLYGFASPGDNNQWITTVTQLPKFLASTCLTYCEFFELWKSGLVAFRNSDQQDGGFPECEPCCLDRITIEFTDQREAQQQGLLQLAIFIRLWRKLRQSRCFCYSFAQLRDICDVLHLFNGTGLNPDFIRQLAAFQMLRDRFSLALADPQDPPAATAIDAERTHLLALWVGPPAAKWGWAVRQLIDGVVRRCEHRSVEFVEQLNSKLDALSQLAGFDPASTTDNWHALPTHTLRFAEVLAKIAASRFSLEEVLYLFAADEDAGCDYLFPLQEESEALELPLDLPGDECEFSLWRLRRELLDTCEIALSTGTDLRISVTAEDERREEALHLEARIREGHGDEWDWRRVVAVLQDELGFAASDVLDLGRHFFPHLLQREGYLVDGASTRFVSKLPAAKTTAAIWGEGPFQYDVSAEQLWTRIPLADHSVIAQLTRLQALNADEQNAVQDLYFQPRAMLALFAVLFPDFPEAVRLLVEEEEAHQRWDHFRRYVACCHHRCHLIARHLSRHVAAVTHQECPEDQAAALLILRELFGDENKASTDWEKDDGTEPAVTWTPPANGGAFAALLGLVGTGLVAEYKVEGGGVVWRDVTGSLSGFGRVRDGENAPVPSILPSLAATISPALAKFVSVRNGFLVKNTGGALLGGAQGFDVTWSGALLVDEEGPYEFWAGLTGFDDEGGECEPADQSRWHVLLKRGSKSWVLLSRRWPGEEERGSAARHLKRGAYELTVELVRPSPEFATENLVHRLHTGLELKYAGPDTGCQRIAIPQRQLFSILKEQTIGDGIAGLGAGAALFLGRIYTSSFRDIRRTYQRAFKAVLFTRRLMLSAQRHDQGTSELGYMLEEGARFAGASYYRSGSGFVRHLANLDFNFLPLADNFHVPAADSRAKPSAQRMQALFDWWERLFDYTVARDDVRRRRDRSMWHLFAEAHATKPADPTTLLARMGTDQRFWRLVLRYFQAQNVAVYAVTSEDLEDERWALRVWHADRWLASLDCRFAVKDMTAARPDLWASDDPSALVLGETETANGNLSAFLCNGCLENGDPRRYDELQRLNDGLRERGRRALLEYLCHLDRVPLPWFPGKFAERTRDLSDLLLLDVEAGICERASRIEEAISAVQSLIRRARLRMEPGWMVTREFARMWDRQYVTFHVWQTCKRRQLYKENWVEWADLEKARGVEAFRFLEENLRSSTLSVAAPGGAEWWPDDRPPTDREPRLLQKREPSALQLLPSTREGFNLLATPERDARPSWLATVRSEQAARGRGTPESHGTLPFWMESAIRLGTRFCRIAAASVPPAALLFEPRSQREDCVTCCEECGCSHPDLVDEYYFWLLPTEVYEPAPGAALAGAPSSVAPAGDYQNGYQDDYYDAVQQQSAIWQDPNQLPQLLTWRPQPAVRLAWCRIHNGEFQQPRRSMRAVKVDPTMSTDLYFLGRTADSLTFSVSASGKADASDPGFRYDLLEDSAVVLPEVVPAPPPPVFLGLAKLPAYPWFLFDAPGAPVMPLSAFSPSLAVAKALRSHCGFEGALAWYRQVFNPLQRDCTWIDCQQDDAQRVPRAQQHPTGDACCDSTNITCDQARDRAVILEYLETLIEWSEAVMRRGNSPEAFAQARTILDTAATILGEAPCSVKLSEPSDPGTVSEFSPAFPALNPRLLDLYEIVRDRLANIRACMNPYRLRNESRGYFSSDPVREGWRTMGDPCAEETEWCYLRSPYRFIFLIQKAQEYATRVQELGNALQMAFEKGDAEFLASLHSGQERELLTLGLEAKQDMWRDVDWQIEALQKTKAVSQASFSYFTNLKSHGLIGGEVSYEALTEASTLLRAAGNGLEAAGGAMSATGNYFAGVAGFGGTPLYYYQLPIGQPLAFDFASAARIMLALADIATSNAGLQLTEASFQRRLDEWNHEIDVLTIEIQQIERQILGAQRRRDQLLHDLNTHQRQIDQSREVQDFLRDKFTAHDLYLHLQKETFALYSKTYDLALYAARQAQHAFNLERGHTTRHFLPKCAWDDLHEGLLAGERLSTALRQMEKAYFDQNVREYELTKHFSLRLHFPAEFLKLLTTGYCEIDIPEWMFDLDFPGHYMRRIKSIALTIPCVAGPFTGVHCRLTLLSSFTRTDPRLTAPIHECCCPPEPCCTGCLEEERLGREYLACPDDPRAVRQYGAREAVATSNGQNDSGLFQLDLNDPRYLPFEYMGAVSRWRIELPPENNYFDRDTLTDFVLRLGYTAREGGAVLRRAANAAARHHLPGDGWRFLDVRHEFPDAWQRFLDCSRANQGEARLKLRLDRKMFPFVPGGREIRIGPIAIFFDRYEHGECDCARSEGCPCPTHGRRASFTVGFSQNDAECESWRDISCWRSERPSDLYSGLVETRLEPIGGTRRHSEVEFRFECGTESIQHLYMLCRYSIIGSGC